MKGSLFSNNRIRDRKGRYCTKERYYTDLVLEENKVLRIELSKYKKLYDDAERKINELQERVKQIE